VRRILLAVLISGLGLVGVVFAQGHGGGSGGGHSGGGHAGGGYGNGSRGGWNHFRGGVVVPYAVPYVGGYGYYGGPGYYGGYYDPSVSSGYVDPSTQQDQSYDSGLPSVMVNPSYVPDRANPQVQEYGAPMAPPPDGSSMRMYQNRSYPYADVQGQPMQRGAPGNDEPTIYLIAFKDHTIVQALGYWVDGGTLHYVSMEHTINQASMNLIDRSLSQRLNDERNVEFKLPAR
jgi:hypothetical protein